MTSRIVWGACALAFACVMSGCYVQSASCEDSETCPPPAYDGGTPDTDHSFDGGRKDASTIIVDDAGSGGGDTTSGGSGSAGSGGGGSGTAICAPGAACGGLYACDDSCFGEDCCRLYCTCTDPTGQSGTQQCSLACN